MIASIIVLFGLPMTIGVRLVAKTSGADIAPEPAGLSDVLQSRDATGKKWPTWICRPIRRECCVLVGQEEVTSLVVFQIGIRFGVFLVIWK